MIINIKFEGIDGFCRPIFKAEDSNLRYGSVNKLFSATATEEEVKKEITTDDLLYFGRHFGCEPLGNDPVYDLVII